MSSAVVSSEAKPSSLPQQCVYIDHKAYNVLGAGSSTFRDPTGFFNPTGAEPPVFQIFNPTAMPLLGKEPSIRQIAEDKDYAFAHEAPVYLADKNEVWWCSNAGGALGRSGLDQNNKIFKINLDEAEKGPATVHEVIIEPEIQMTNGGTLYKDGKVLFVNSGRGDRPPNVTVIDTTAPHKSTVLLDNFYGRQFNSINDVKVHPVSRAIFFTDVTYGYIHGFRPARLLPNQVYRLDPTTGSVRVVADQFDKCNGIAFSHDGKLAYVTDTGAAAGKNSNATDPATIYEYDFCERTERFLNRRVFCYVDKRIPDGIQLDAEGNVYTGCGDGVNVFNPSGDLLFKVYIGSGCAQMIFAGDGRMVVLAETKVFLVHFAVKTGSLDYWS